MLGGEILIYNGSEYVCRMRKLEWCISAMLLCVEQDGRRVLFIMEQEISWGKNNMVI